MIDPSPYWSQIIEFGRRLIAEASREDQSGIIRDFLANVFNCQAYVVLFTSPEDRLNPNSWKADDAPENVKQRLINASVSKQTTIFNDDISSYLDILETPTEGTLARTQNAVASPINFNDQIYGVCSLFRKIGSSFSPTDIEFLEFILSYSALVIVTNIKESKERFHSDLLNLVSYVSAQITQLENLNDLSDRITRIIQKTFDYYYVAIFTIEEGCETLNFRNSAGKTNPLRNSNIDHSQLSENSMPSPQIEVRIGQGIIGNVALSGEEIISNDVGASQYYRYEDILPETKSEAALPIKVGDKILGVLDVQSNEANTFQEIDLLVLRGLSDNIAVAIENSGLYIDLQKRLNQLRSIYDVSNAITSILKFEDLLEQVISSMKQYLGYSSVRFYTFNPPSGNIIYQRSEVNENIDESSFDLEYQIDNQHSPVSWVARKKEHLLIEDYLKESDLVPITSAGNDIRSELLVPLIFAGNLLGVLDIQSEKPYSFGKDDLFIVEALADNIAVALRNSNLYRSEQWRRQVADSLREVAGLLSADISLDQVLLSILNELINTLPSVIAVIWLKDEDYGDGDNEISPQLRLSAIKGLQNFHPGYDEQDLNLEDLLDLSIDEIIETHNLDRSVKFWLLDVINSSSPVIRDLKTPYEPIGALLSLNPDYSAISAPLRISDKTLGVLTLIHDRSGKYGENSQLLTSTFASYAAVAIENTRLYEAAHDQAWVSTVLLQVAQAMQSIDSLDELQETIVQILPDLIGANSCAILLWDDDTNSFVPGMASGFSPQQFTEFESWNISDSDVMAFDQMRTSKAPVIMDQAGIPEDLQKTLFKSFDFSDGLYMLFPLIAQNEVIGMIFVELREEVTQISREISLWEEKISIIQGIANQTAIAVENIQLVQAQEEEAYISVALLQVAQAIVNSNTLDETLSSIVRITPILVGVRRSVIYLWDEPHKIYRTSQTYGYSRDELAEMQPFYSPTEFPLLDYVQKNNQIVYFPTAEPLEPIQWTNLSDSDVKIYGSVIQQVSNESQESEIFLSKYPLLVGIPLAVKEKVLGVMLIEEAGQKSAVPSAHVRERRMEIVTGITQQAAIAIQNDILQREVLERERLEREMQLAREIQSTFLPDHLPELKGWDLDIRWRPARQVGGDYYDIFELPDNHLGIVIADVADKGMPAALYMTLVRTLIRAAIHDLLSPKDVLQRVNDLLVPDSRHGMFVTIVYVVLSLDTGELTYVNAGHNPPISKKGSINKVIEHPKNAMALGVFPEIEIIEGKLVLEKGDLFLLYTDGITEAFSSMDELFGYERLKEIILGSELKSASSILDEIESSVIKFSNGLSQSDDVTMVALFRKKD